VALATHVENWEPRSVWFGCGRSILAIAELSVLVFTPIKALLVPAIGMGEAPRCDAVRAASLLCVGGHVVGLEACRWIMIAILVVAASGYRPRWTVLPQAWTVYSIAVSITLPDGGESVAMLMSALIVPICLADDRVWHWQRPVTTAASSWLTVSFVAIWAVRTQLAFVYADSSLSKFGVADWANGTAEYYFLRDNMFGVDGPFAGLLLSMSKSVPVVIGMTWGALIVELVIAICLLSSDRWRKVALLLDISLHAMIILTMGLWSFASVMIGSAVVASTPNMRRSLTPDELTEGVSSEQAVPKAIELGSAG
jgi:antimicrobial peptide system SdpB family protein